ncbi:unnamed protein product [Sphagnum jensenii]|uniref:Homeobox domain-containing protein n=1 Tax=Sphagnum jensenii TaxID=128206 RepID=A0ABP0W4V7_9BRYO
MPNMSALNGTTLSRTSKRNNGLNYTTFPLCITTAGDDDSAGDVSAAGHNNYVEKKRRLNFDQVKSLEKNFELENKLEPERKIQLAKELGLQPRQVAVWFQNRRARWKTKQLERDYQVLSLDYNRLKNQLEAVLQEKQELQAKTALRRSNSKSCNIAVDSSQLNVKPDDQCNSSKDADVDQTSSHYSYRQAAMVLLLQVISELFWWLNWEAHLK